MEFLFKISPSDISLSSKLFESFDGLVKYTNGKIMSLNKLTESTSVAHNLLEYDNFNVLDNDDITNLINESIRIDGNLPVEINLVETADRLIGGLNHYDKHLSYKYTKIKESVRNLIVAKTNKYFPCMSLYEDYVGENPIDVFELKRVKGLIESAYLVTVYGKDASVTYKVTNEMTIPLFTTIDGKPYRLTENKEVLQDIYATKILEGISGKEYPKYVSIISEGTIKDAAKKVRHGIVQGDKKVSGAIDGTVEDIKSNIKKMMLPDAREDLIKDTMPSVSKLIKQALAIGLAWAVNPAVAAITAITIYAVNKDVKRNERRKILSELKEELELTEEKIKDAESKSDNKSKYQLMRLRNKLKSSIEKIKYGDNLVDGRDSID